MEKTDENLAKAHDTFHRVYSDWVESLQSMKDYDDLDAAIKALGASVSITGGTARSPVLQAKPGPVQVQIVEIPERVITVGAKLTGGDD
jgi:hypothetical protein